MRLHLFCVLLLALEVYSRSAKVTSRHEASDPDENHSSSSHEHQSSSFGGDLDLSHWNDIGAPCLQIGDQNVNKHSSDDDRCKNLHEWEKALIQLSFEHLESSKPADTNSQEPPKTWNESPQQKLTNQNSETWSFSPQQENKAQNQVTTHQYNPWISIPQENSKPSKNVPSPFPNNHQVTWQLPQPSKNIVIPFPNIQDVWKVSPQQNNHPSKNIVPFPINQQETWSINPKQNNESPKTFPNNHQETWKPSREIPTQFLSSKQQESKFYPVESTRSSSTKKQVNKEQPVYVHLQMPADIAQHAGEMFGPYRLHLPIKVPEIKLYLAAEVVSAGQGTKQTDGRKQRTDANNNNKGPWHQ